jgi:SecD/SecF fusion protein
MSSLGATFTLPGIAGIVLTIGMCVDANVLIFERIREELARGSKMYVALRLGYQKASAAIIDGNLTNLIVCIILYYTATADVKGFAVTLGIGIIATLFTAVFMTRVIFEAWYRLFPKRKMNMLPIALPMIDRLLTPKIDWYGLRKAFWVFSAVVLMASLVLVFSRGQDMLDIEFRSGTEVSFDLAGEKLMALPEARKRLADAGLEDFQVIPLDAENQLQSHSFSVVSIESDAEKVTAKVQRAFEGLLDIKPVLSFKAVDAQAGEAPVYPVTRESLGQVINRPAVEDRIGEFVGGVAIVLDEIQPSVTATDLEERIRFMRAQPDYQDSQFRRFRVVGLSPDPQNPGRFTSVAVLSSDEEISYFEDQATWQSTLAAGEWRLVRDALTRESSFSKVTNFDPTVATTLANQAIVAMLLSVIAIIVYIWFRFGSFRYGVMASVALVHDVIWTLGFLALGAFVYDTAIGHALLLEPFKINMAVIAALLTLVGYSLNDTIIVFDRIREVRGRLGYVTPQIINDAINQTISRTALTGGTTFLAIVFMYAFGGAGVHGFAFAMTVGVVVGTYSSVAIAAPLLLFGVDNGNKPGKPIKRNENSGSTAPSQQS